MCVLGGRGSRSDANKKPPLPPSPFIEMAKAIAVVEVEAAPPKNRRYPHHPL